MIEKGVEGGVRGGTEVKHSLAQSIPSATHDTTHTHTHTNRSLCAFDAVKRGLNSGNVRRAGEVRGGFLCFDVAGMVEL